MRKTTHLACDVTLLATGLDKSQDRQSPHRHNWKSTHTPTYNGFLLFRCSYPPLGKKQWGGAEIAMSVQEWWWPSQSGLTQHYQTSSRIFFRFLCMENYNLNPQTTCVFQGMKDWDQKEWLSLHWKPFIFYDLTGPKGVYRKGRTYELCIVGRKGYLFACKHHNKGWFAWMVTWTSHRKCRSIGYIDTNYTTHKLWMFVFRGVIIYWSKKF